MDKKVQTVSTSVLYKPEWIKTIFLFAIELNSNPEKNIELFLYAFDDWGL